MCDVNRRDALARFTVGHDLKHRIAGISKVSGLVNCKLFRLIFCSRLSTKTPYILVVPYCILPPGTPVNSSTFCPQSIFSDL